MRSATIYVEPRTIKRLRLLLRLYPQHTTEVGNMREKTADEVADALINEVITTKYPLVKQLETLLAATEKGFMQGQTKQERKQQ